MASQPPKDVVAFLSSDAGYVVLICVLGLLSYVGILVYFLCCRPKRTWGPALGLEALHPGMRFVSRRPENEEEYFQHDNLPAEFIKGSTLGALKETGELMHGRVVCAQGSVGMFVGNSLEEVSSWSGEPIVLHPEVYGTIKPGQFFRLLMPSARAQIALETYRHPTEEERKDDEKLEAEEEEEAKKR